TMHASLRRVDGGRRNRSRRPRRAHGYWNLSRMARLFAVRKLYRSLSDRNAPRRDLPSPNTAVGARAVDHHVQLLFGRLSDVAWFAWRRSASLSSARSLRERNQRRVSLR